MDQSVRKRSPPRTSTATAGKVGDNTLETPPSIFASSSRTTVVDLASLSPPVRKASSSSYQTMQQPLMMDLSASTSISSIESSPFHQPSSRRLFHDTPTSSQYDQVPHLVSPTAFPVPTEAHTPTASTGAGDQDVFGKIDHTPLRQETHSTSPLPNSRSLQMGDMLDHVLDADQFQRLSVGNIIAPERGSSKKKPKRLPTDPQSTTASPTPLSRSTARSRSALTSIAVNQGADTSGDSLASTSAASDPFMQPSYPSADKLSLHVKHQMAALQESPKTY